MLTVLSLCIGCFASLSDLPTASAQSMPSGARQGWSFGVGEISARQKKSNKGSNASNESTAIVAGTSKKRITGKTRILGKANPRRLLRQRVDKEAVENLVLQNANAYDDDDNNDVSEQTATKPQSDDRDNSSIHPITSSTSSASSASIASTAASGNFSIIDSADAVKLELGTPTVTQWSSSDFGKRSGTVNEAFTELAAKFEKSVVQISSRNGKQILGTVVTSDGLIITKASCISETGSCIFSDGEKWPWRKVATDPRQDLSLIRVSGKRTLPITFAMPPQQEIVYPGTIAVSIGRSRSVAAWGVVTMPKYNFAIEQPECKDCTDLGATMSPYPVPVSIGVGSTPTAITGAIKVLRVYPRTLAERVGLLVEDQIKSFNGHTIRSRRQLDAIASTMRVGDIITADVYRNGSELRLSHKISDSMKKTIHDRWGGGPYSQRRFGFGPTLVHDSVLHPENCGGPLVDLEGHLLGINIARSMRVASLTILPKDVVAFLQKHDPNMRLNFATLPTNAKNVVPTTSQ